MKTKTNAFRAALVTAMTLWVALGARAVTNEAVAWLGTPGNDLIFNLFPTNAMAVINTSTNPLEMVATTATGVAGLDGQDSILSTAALKAETFTEINVPLVMSSTIGTGLSLGIAGGAGQDIITNFSSLISTSRVDTTIGEFILQLDVLFTGAPTTAEGQAVGIDGGRNPDIILNTGSIQVNADSLSQINKGSISLLDVPLDLTGWSDAKSTADARATGIAAGLYDSSISATPETITNYGSIGVGAMADAGTFSMRVEMVGAAHVDDATIARAMATGIVGSASSDVISHFGTMNVDASAETDIYAVELKMKGLLIEGFLSFIGQDVGKINTLSQAHATGMDSGGGNDALLNAQTNGTFYVHSLANADSWNATVAISPPVSMGIAANAPPGGAGLVGTMPALTGITGSATATNTRPAFARADTKAWATAMGMSGGEGDDAIDNLGPQKTFAEAYADSIGIGVEISLSKTNWIPIPSAAFADASTAAEAEAVGLDGGGGNDILRSSGSLEASAHGESDSVGVAFAFKGSTKGLNAGVTITDTSSDALAKATGISAGAGHDRITNTAPILASSTAESSSVGISVEVAVDKEGVAAGVAYADAGSVASGTAIGIDGGTGDDLIHNTASVSAIGGSTNQAVSVGVALNGTLDGVSGSVTLADSSAQSTNLAVGILDSGSDTVINSGTVTGAANADTFSGSFDLSIAFSKTGLAAGVALGDATTTSRADAFGVDLSGQGTSTNGDTILNTGSIVSSAGADNLALSVAVGFAGAAEGVTAGVSATKADATAHAYSTAIRTGADDDTIISDGTNYLKSSAVADAASTSIAVTLSGAKQGAALGASLADTTTAATAGAKAIETGNGNDTIINRTAITNSAIANASSVSVAASISGAWEGVALGATLTDGTTKANATAAGIDAGAGNDAVTNTAPIVSAATATGDSHSIAVTVAVAPKGVSAGFAMATAETTSTATSAGITGGAGDDSIANTSLVSSHATANTTVESIAINFAELGAAIVDVGSTAAAAASGIDGGTGIDWLGNQGAVDVAANSTIDGLDAAANFIGYASADAGMTNIASAVGMNAGNDAGAQTILNATGGSVSVLAHSKTDLRNYVFQAGGGSFMNATVVGSAAALGLVTGAGDDVILNGGTNRATAWSQIDVGGVNFQFMGVQVGTAGMNSWATATGIEAGNGQNFVTNASTGLVSSYTKVDTATAELNAGFSVGFGVSGVTADAFSRGVHTGSDADSIANFGGIDATAAARGESTAGSMGLFGLNISTSLAHSIVEGINAGEDNDWILNAGSINAGQIRSGDSALARADSQAITMDFLSFSLASLGAEARVSGVAGAGGDDTILNAGTVNVGNSSTWMGWGEAFAFGGQFIGITDSYGGSSSKVTASGLDGGSGTNTLVNFGGGEINVDARSGAKSSSTTYLFTGFLLPSLADSSANATVTAAAIQGGAGTDIVGNAGAINVLGYASAQADSDSEITLDLDTRAQAKSHAAATANAAGIDLGAAVNFAQNSGSITSSAVALAKTYAVSSAEFESTLSEAYARPVATAAGILAGNDGNTLINGSNGTITVNAAVKTTDALGNASYANSDSGRDALSVAGGKSGASYVPITANATGIATGSGADAVSNDGSITVNARSDGIVSANTHVWYRYPRSDSLAYVAATGKGIAAGAGQNSVVNNGSLDVTTWGHAVPKSYSWSRDYRATANSFADVDAYAIGIEADGVVSNTAAGEMNIVARATSYSEADTGAENTYAKANLYADATGFTPAAGASATNFFFNEGAVHVLASAGEDDAGNRLRIGYAHSSVWVRSVGAESSGTSVVHAVGMRFDDRPGCFVNNGVLSVEGRARGDVYANGHSRDYHPAGVAYMTTDALAQGILAGNGDNVLVNKGLISVTAYGDSFANAYADENVGVFRDEEARGTAYANARAGGILTGNGNNYILNEGTIAVTSHATAGVWVDTEDNDDEYRFSAASASVFGIQTGSGHDTIYNSGTLTSTNFNATGWVAGTAIDSGAGDDTVSLLANSYTRGGILLGAGDDTLELSGAPTLEGTVNAGAGTDRLTLHGAGSLAGGGNVAGFEQAIKSGAGTFSLSQLATVRWMKIEAGALQLNSGYQFGSNSLFETQLQRDGSGGFFRTPANAELAGEFKVQRGAGPFAIGSTLYDVIVATNGLTGTFSETNLPAPRPLITFGLHYLPDRARVEAEARSFTTVAQNRVERAVGNYLDRVLPGIDGDLAQVLDTFQQLSEPEFPAAFSSLSPDSYDDYSLVTHNLVRQYSRGMQQRLDTLRLNAASATGDPRDAMVPGQNPMLLAYAGATGEIGSLLARERQREANLLNSIWFTGFGQWGNLDSDDGYTGYSFSPWGLSLGYDRALGDALTLGLSAAYASTHLNLDDRRGGGDIKSYSGAAYGSYFRNHVHVEGVLSYGYNDYDCHRNLAVGGLSRTAQSTHYGHALGGFISGGYVWQFKRWALEPFASLQYSYLDEDSFEESGADSVSLWLRDRQTQALASELGVRLACVLRSSNFTLIPELSAAWNYKFNIDDREIIASYAGSPQAAFRLPGRDLDPNGLSTGAALTLLLGKGVSTSVRYNGELRDDYSVHMVGGELRFSF
ncbi:MAG TPA: autotransporter outer membrane beta-barrel domain-containing protein [Candidatus Paceibacterota bacterium]|nr:autotransporter outer membrane beta-barrel domain-containing protein [Verrucomicrobiota bacterium]HSA12449.1 autotransporter outer membrane beta-barrel domain-containing protein [Candidatus Paceibacterota bacterium]